MTELFMGVLSKNITATYCILLVCIARIFLRKAPRFYSYILWLIVGVRLICPVYLESNFSLMQTGANLTFDNISEVLPDELFSFVSTDAVSTLPGLNTSGLSDDVFGEAQDEKSIPSLWLDIMAVIWIVGILAVSVYHIWGLRKLHRKLALTAKPSLACCLWKTIGKDKNSAGKRWEVPVWEVKNLSVPFVMGFLPFGKWFSPRIYLPANLEKQERRYVLAHECIHIRRMDYVMKPFAFFLVCLNWFNPFVWFAFHLMNMDMEMSCDEEVIKGYGLDAKRQYSRTLLLLASRNKMTRETLPAFGDSSIKSRIKNIMNNKRPGVWITLACILLVTVLIVGLTTNPEVDSSGFNGLEEELHAKSTEESRLWGTVNTDTLRVRALPNDEAEVVELLPKGENVEIIALGKMELPESSSLNGEWDRKYVAVNITKEETSTIAYVQSKYLDLMEDTSEDTKRLWVAKEWAEAFCARDGESLLRLAADKEGFIKLDMAEISEQGEFISFGWSSPWPWGSYRVVLPTEKENDITIYYYAQTSDPNVAVWSQTLKTVDGLPEMDMLEELMQNVILSYSELTIYDRITTSQAFLDAYAPGEESVHFYDFESGGLTDAIAKQISDGDTEAGITYGSPGIAVEKLLNLYDGVAEVVKEDAGNAMVRYTFQDGVSFYIPMYAAVETPKVWSVVSNVDKSVLLNE